MKRTVLAIRAYTDDHRDPAHTCYAQEERLEIGPGVTYECFVSLSQHKETNDMSLSLLLTWREDAPDITSKVAEAGFPPRDLLRHQGYAGETRSFTQVRTQKEGGRSCEVLYRAIEMEDLRSNGWVKTLHILEGDVHAIYRLICYGLVEKHHLLTAQTNPAATLLAAKPNIETPT